jgi:hypothetical protein
MLSFVRIGSSKYLHAPTTATVRFLSFTVQRTLGTALGDEGGPPLGQSINPLTSPGTTHGRLASISVCYSGTDTDDAALGHDC